MIIEADVNDLYDTNLVFELKGKYNSFLEVSRVYPYEAWTVGFDFLQPREIMRISPHRRKIFIDIDRYKESQRIYGKEENWKRRLANELISHIQKVNRSGSIEKILA